MKNNVLFFLLGLSGVGFAQSNPANYDESKIPPYTLPDALTTLDGQKIKRSQEWQNTRRPEILQLFADHVYGQMPKRTVQMKIEKKTPDATALNGLATRQETTISFPAVPNSPKINVLLYIPNAAPKPSPAFLALNFCGNQCVSADSTIPLSMSYAPDFCKGYINNRATEASRASQEDRWPLKMILKKGFAVVTAHYGDTEPDFADGWRTGLRGTMAQALGLQPQEWSAMGAWAWQLSRIMDYLEKEPALNATQVVVLGHSRLGKAALWAAANDLRFAGVVSNNSGEGGAALSKREFGETIETINKAFPHWFVAKYKTYNANTAALPVDQHLLLSLIAPRPLYVASAEGDRWADPKGEFLSARETTPVYALYGKKGLGISEMPPVNQPVGQTVRYHIRNGGHDIKPYDWEQYTAFFAALWK